MSKIAILGTGAWGTALANVLIENHHSVAMWGIEKKQVDDLKKQVNTTYYQNHQLSKKLTLTTLDINEIVQFAPQYVILAIPSIHIENVLKLFTKKFKSHPVYINVSKGFNQATKKTWSPTIEKIIHQYASGLVDLIGPSFAIEVFYHQPTIVNVVSTDLKLAKKVAKLFDNDYFKCVPIDDVVGAETISALKNVMAIASGILYAQHKSINTRSAILAQMAKEISLILQKLHGKLSTLYEYCGIGDIILTCTDNKSRNFCFGNLIATKGMKYASIQLKKTTVEGYWATKITYDIIQKYHLHAPIITNLYQIIFLKANPNLFLTKIFAQIK